MTKKTTQEILFLFLINLITLSIGYSQINVNGYKPIKDLEWRGLTGKVYFIPFFIDTHNGEFEEEEIDYYLNEIEKSKEWILNAAQDYPDVRLEIINGYVDSHTESVFLDNVYNWNKGSNYSTANRVAQDLGYENIAEYVSFQGIDINKGKVVILCFVKQNGRSHAYDLNGNIFSKNVSIDHAIVFCNTKFGTYTSNKIITHEILHLFRAWDLYGGEPQNQAKAKRLMEMYPNSIMLSTYGDKVSNLDEINAWRIGWNLNPKDFFTEYKPEYKKNMKNRNREKNAIKFDLKRKKKKIEEKN